MKERPGILSLGEDEVDSVLGVSQYVSTWAVFLD